MPPRKRRRSVAFAPDDDDDDINNRTADNPFDDGPPAEERANSGVWDAFREEHHEVLEQLPLALQRAFSLIRELDDQAQSNNTALADCLRRYLQARTDHSRNGGGSATAGSLSSSSKGLISRVAAITEENSRAAQERVNIAQSAYDSVDRQIRLLDHSIEEVEAIISPASHLDPRPRRILSYTVTGRWLRPQIEPPPQPPDQLSGIQKPPTIEFPVPDRPRGKPSTTSRKNRKGKKKKNTHEQRALQPPETSVAGDVLVHTPDPNEPRYCYCNNVSYGAMVQCENSPRCPHDWFHYDCIGLKKAPKGKWFCPSCKPDGKGVSRKSQM